MAKMLLIDVINKEVREVEIGIGANAIEEIHQLLHCECFALACRRVGDKRFGIYLDDDGLIKDEEPIVSAIGFGEILVGNLLIFNIPIEGSEEQSLTKEDIALLKASIMDESSHPVLMGIRV